MMTLYQIQFGILDFPMRDKKCEFSKIYPLNIEIKIFKIWLK